MEIDRQKMGIGDVLIKPVKEKDLLESIGLALGLLNDETTAQTTGARRKPAAAQLDVLVAEDNTVNQRLLIGLLEKHGHHVSLAHNGRQAVQLYQNKNFDLVLMDVQMPEVDGYQATEQIRQLQAAEGQRVPIIALTAHASPADRRRCLAAGMDEYMSKPIRAKSLFALIEKLTGHPSKLDGSMDPNSEKPKHIDWEHAFDTVGGDRKLLEELIGVFLKDQAQILADIESAVMRCDEKNLRLSAHTMKSALTHLGGRVPASIAAELEQLSKNEGLTGAAELLSKLRQNLSLVNEEMQQFIQRSKP
jgi:CheY-like chemotaxis protein